MNKKNNHVLLVFIPVFTACLIVAGFSFFYFGHSKTNGLQFTSDLPQTVGGGDLLANSNTNSNSESGVIHISQVLLLDKNKNLIKDITSLVANKDDNWVTITNNQYVHIVFEKQLTDKNDITLFARASEDNQSIPKVEVYPDYSPTPVVEFPKIQRVNTYKIFLTNLLQTTNTFDLKITGSVDIDHIIDPTGAGIALSTGIKIGDGISIAAPVTGWTCGSALVDSRDSQSYSTVQIGTQCWMAQNLNVGTRVAGSANQTTTCAAGDGSDIQKYCFGNTDAGCTRNISTGNDGGLYQWNQTMCASSSCNGTGSSQPACTTPVQGICPIGWHIPSHYEWNLLELTVCAIDPTDASCATQFPYDTSTTGWKGTTTETVGTKLQIKDATHFSGLLAGYRGTDGSFHSLGSYAYFWTSLDSSGNAWYRHLGTGNALVYRNAGSKLYGFSVRCLKN